MTRGLWLICVLVLTGCTHSSPDTHDAASNSSPSPSPSFTSPSPSPPEAAGSSSPSQNSTTIPSIRIADKHGTVNIGPAAVDPRTLHVPLYPGATQSSGIGSFSDSDPNGSTAITTLDAHASFEQVDAWYKSHVPAGAQPTHLTVGGESTASYEWTSADGRADRVVTVNSNQGKPVITISVRITK